MQNLSGIVRTKREPREIKILTPPPSLFFWYIYISLSISSTYFFHHSALKLFFDREVQRTLCQRARFWSRPSSSNVAIPWGMVASREKKRVLLCCRQSPAHNGSLLFINAKREREPFPFQVKRGMRSALAHNTLSSCARSSWDYTVSTLDSYRETQMLP